MLYFLGQINVLKGYVISNRAEISILPYKIWISATVPQGSNTFIISLWFMIAQYKIDTPPLTVLLDRSLLIRQEKAKFEARLG